MKQNHDSVQQVQTVVEFPRAVGKKLPQDENACLLFATILHRKGNKNNLQMF